MEVSSSTKEQLRVKVETLQAVLQQCQRAIESLKNTPDDSEDGVKSTEDLSSPCVDEETDEVMYPTARDLGVGVPVVRGRSQGVVDVGYQDSRKPRSKLSGKFLTTYVYLISEEGSSWDVVGKNDLWEGGNIEPDQEGYVLVEQEDIVEGIACFMTAYLLSLKETKVLSPNQLQKALSNTFSIKKKRGKLQKAWDGSKAFYNVASWGATAIGIYQNPALLNAASMAFWKSCHVVSKFF
ncbi:hypothetical protein GIB67_018594 [Kingdonia uniflora]|uniref:Uncharacterized protein n=1 Tax=Kingdonia uniflora TaxID=39325 RepID=A0A7J7L8E5_9MAGN|nr:hypothetical protein GIB67_018594 [Kingdonia uniflora]